MEMIHAVAPDAAIRELLLDPADVKTPATFAGWRLHAHASPRHHNAT
jgi:hypothetical protein